MLRLKGQHHGDRVLGRAHGVSGRSVHHHDAQAGGGTGIDVVSADAGADDGLEAVIAFQGIGRDFDAATANGAVELGQRRAEGIPFETGAHFVADAGGGIQHGQPFGGNRVQNNDFGHSNIARLRRDSASGRHVEKEALCPMERGCGRSQFACWKSPQLWRFDELADAGPAELRLIAVPAALGR